MSALYDALARAAAEGPEPNARRIHAFLDPSGVRPVELQPLQVTNPRDGSKVNFYAHALDREAYVRLSLQMEQYAAQGVYVILNPVNPAAVVAREQGGRTRANEYHLMERGRSTTDADILARGGVFVDFDFDRPSGTSSTDEELEKVCTQVERFYADLAAILGGYDSIAVGCSGNGCSVFVALDYLLETPELRKTITEILHAIKTLYDTDGVKVDAHLHDPKRLVPAFGTVKRKGPPNDPLRPHRRTSILTPNQVRRLSFAELVRLRDTLVARLPPKPAHAPVQYTPVVDEASGESDAATAPPSDDALDFKSLRARLVAMRRNKAGSTDEKDADSYNLLTATLNGTMLATPGTVPPVEGVFSGRSKAVNKAAWLLAFAFPPGTPWETASVFLRPTIAAMDCMPEGLEHWLQVAERSYDNGLGKALQHDAERKKTEAENKSAAAALLELAPATLPPATPGTPGFLAAVTAIASAAPAIDDAWMEQFIRTADRKIKACPHNVYLFLTNAPAVKGTIRFNDVTNDIDVVGGPFATMPPAVLATAVQNWVHKVGKLEVPKGTIEDQLLLVAYENRYDPIKDYLNALRWDGVNRLDDFFFRYVRGRRVNADGKDISDHLRRVGRKWFVSAVARAMQPGCQNDTMLVLEGLEGEGKTSLLRTLFFPWYVVVKLGYERDDHMVQGGAWGVEFGELASSRKSDDELLKQHLSTPEDTYRPPYGRRPVKYKRRNVFVGTTNEEHWLTPGKGKRRYWPVYVELVDLEATARDKDQLFAEAVVRYRGYKDVFGTTHAPEKWHFIGEERAEADAEAGLRMDETLLHQKIQQWYLRMPVGKRPGFVTLIDVTEGCLQLPVDRANGDGIRKEVRHAMHRLGFTEARRGARQSRVTGWAPSEALLNAVAGKSEESK